MTAPYADRVQETSTTTGTGTLTLAGAVVGFQSFATAFPSASTASVPYTITDAAGNWETGHGTYTLSGTTLTRSVVSSSNAGALVSFAAGSKNVFCAMLAEDAVGLAINNLFTKPQITLPVTLTMSGGNVATDASTGNNFEITLSANATFLNPTNPVDGQIGNWVIRQPATGGPWTGTFGTYFDFGGAGAPTLSVTASKVDLVSAYYDSTSTHWIASFRKGS